MSKVVTVEFGKRLKELRNNNQYTMDGLCEEYNKKFDTNLNKGTLSKYENGLQEPLFTTVRNFSELFNVSVEYMIGKTDNKYSHLENVNFKKIVPVLGVIAAGCPILAQENIESYENVEDSSIDYCLRVKGSSMIGARIFEGDIVYVSKDAAIENGDIVVALVDGENATIKRYYKYGNKIILKPENPTMKEMEFNSKDKDFQVLGKVKEVKFKL